MESERMDGKEHVRSSSSQSFHPEIPPRNELLSIIRKHSVFLKQPAVNNESNRAEEGDVDMRFWKELLDMFFVRGMRNLKETQDDDLVFFVRHMDDQSNDKSIQPYFVRRWASQLGKIIGDNAKEVDWQRSLFLNLIAHTSYTLTVAICRRESLQNQRGTNSQPGPIYQVSKTVYASPSRVNFHTDMSKGFETVPAYPDICFMVDDYDDTFEEVILVESDQCYCVFLNANGGAAFSTKDSNVGKRERISPENYLLGELQNANAPQLTLFSGFVGYDMVRSAFEGGRSRVGSLFVMGLSSARSERLIMHGPGGRGELEVSVSGLPDENSQNVRQAASSWRAKSAARISTIVHKAAIAASLAATYVASSGSKDNTETLPLRCCLMSLSLPWDVLAHDLLFKDFPSEDK